ncbi:MAG: hypothetical protein AABX33_05165 [Nanoarchaeota archaeon]
MKPKNIVHKADPNKEWLFIKSLKLAKSNPGKTGLMILFDAMFILSLFGFKTLGSYLGTIPGQPSTRAWVIIMLIFVLAYYLLILFSYSFFKYCLLDFIKSLFHKTEFTFRRLGQFYILNIIIGGIFLGILLMASFILESIKQEYAPYTFIFLAIPYLLLLYIITNASHSLFYEGASIKQSVKDSFKLAFTGIRLYRETILVMILSALLLLLLFFGSGYLLRMATSKNYGNYLIAYAYFKQIAIIAFDFVLYWIILINRISFYELIREDMQKIH